MVDRCSCATIPTLVGARLRAGLAIVQGTARVSSARSCALSTNSSARAVRQCAHDSMTLEGDRARRGGEVTVDATQARGAVSHRFERLKAVCGSRSRLCQSATDTPWLLAGSAVCVGGLGAHAGTGALAVERATRPR
jgi:hypothetical protein